MENKTKTRIVVAVYILLVIGLLATVYISVNGLWDELRGGIMRWIN